MISDLSALYNHNSRQDLVLFYDKLLQDAELYILKHAKAHDLRSLHLSLDFNQCDLLAQRHKSAARLFCVTGRENLFC